MRTEFEIEQARIKLNVLRREIMYHAGKEDPHVLSMMGLAATAALEALEWFTGDRDTVVGIQLTHKEEVDK